MSTEKGKWAEEKAQKVLSEKGHTILEQNWRFKHLEVDIISKDKNILVFTEVKYRENDFFGPPQGFVNRKKQKNIITAANAYLEKKDLDMDVRFDVLALSKKYTEHFEEAFRPY